MNIKSRSDRHVLLADLAFPESPRWHDGRLWVSDWGANEVIAVDLSRHREVIARVQSFPMCIDHLPDGRLLIVSSADRRLPSLRPSSIGRAYSSRSCRMSARNAGPPSPRTAGPATCER